MKRRSGFLAAALLCVLAASSAALGRSAVDDLSLALNLQGPSAGAKVVTGPAFTIATVVETDGGVQGITLRMALPSGVRLGASPPASLGCSGTTAIVCTTRLEQSSIVFFQYDWGLVAESPGSYEIVASVEGARPDPNPANNSVNFRFEVKAAGGSSSGGGSATVSATTVKLTPAKPKAGSVVTATSSVTGDGSPVKPTKVVCAGTLAGKKVTGKGTSATGRASCRYATPKSAKRKTLAGSIVISVEGKTITKRFSTKLG